MSAQADEIFSLLGKSGKRVLIIPGNNEFPDEIEKVSRKCGLEDIHCSKVQIGGFVFGGVGGKVGDPSRTKQFALTEEEFAEKLKKFKGIKKLILVTHAPPSEIRCLLEFIKKEQPLINACGHCHQHAGKTIKIGRTVVINSGKHGFILRI